MYNDVFGDCCCVAYKFCRLLAGPIKYGTDFENNVPTFRLLKAADVKHLGKSSMSQLRQMRSFMRVVQGLALENHSWPTLNTITCTAVNDMWRKVAPLLIEKYGTESQLNNNFTTGWKSLYNQMSRKGAFVQDE